MQVINERVAGLDVHTKTVTACVRTPDTRAGKTGRRRSQTKKFGTFANDLEALRDWLVCRRRDAGGDGGHRDVCWKPVWYALEGSFDEGDAGQPPPCQEPARAQD